MIQAIAIDDEPPALRVIRSHCEKTDFIDLQKTFTQPTEALKYLKRFTIDLIFVDVQMPAVTGLHLVRSLPQDPMIIFTTAFSEYAAASYDLNAIDYLLKPIHYQRFLRAAEKAREYHQYVRKIDPYADNYLFLRADYSLIKVLMEDIYYIEGMADYLRVHLKNGKEIVTRMTMKDMMLKLPPVTFIRVHRSFILPFASIHTVRNNTIYLEGTSIPIGRTYLEDFNDRFRP